MIGGTATAQNVLLQDAPTGSWQATTKLDVSTLTPEGEQAGFILWQRENPNTFAKITYISKGTYAQYEWVATRNGDGRRSRPGRRSRTPDGDVYLRVSANGSGTYIAEGSTDGEDWQQIAGADHQPRRSGDDEVGLKVSDNAGLATHYAGVRLLPRRLLGQDRRRPRRRRSTTARRTASSAGTRRRRRSTLTADDGARRRRRQGQVQGRRRRAARPTRAPFTVDARRRARGRVLRHRQGGERRDGQDGSRSASTARRPSRGDARRATRPAARRRHASTPTTATRAPAPC